MRKWISLFLSFVASPAMGVNTSHWTHTTEADFKAGTFDGVVATNLGDLKLSREVKKRVEDDPRISAVHCLVEGADGTVYAGTGPQGVVLQIKDGKSTDAADLGDGVNVFSLAIDGDGKLLIGASGENGRILRLDQAGEKPKEILKSEKSQYIWSLSRASDGMLYAATGPHGQLLQIKPTGEHSVLFDSEENNLLSMTSDGKDLLYVGTDPNGLVYRINRTSGDVFVLYDAAETEISALALDKRGNLYAATAQGSDVLELATQEPPAEKSGRPETGDAAGLQPVPGEKPTPPAPPTLPMPGPSDPKPIPKEPNDTPAPEPKQMMILADGDAPGDPAKPDGPGEPDKKPGDQPGGKPTPPRPIPSLGPPGAEGDAEAPAGGNAVYRIDPDGFVTEIFRGPAMVFSLVLAGDSILAATGGAEGLVYEITPAAEEVAVVAKIDPKQILSLLATKDGQVMLGSANTGEIAAMSTGFAKKGTFISPVLDAKQISRFGKLQLNGLLPGGARLSVATRSGNVEGTTDAGWSKWSDESAAAQFVQTASPAARFFQYRLTLSTDKPDGTAVVDEVSVAYQTPNQPPTIASIKVGASEAAMMAAMASAKPSEAAPKDPAKAITWEASDPNEDGVKYSVYFRQGSAGPWILLKENLTDAAYDWNTRAIGDGRYQIRVVASDERANPPGAGKTASRISEAVVVDNTAPVIGDLKWTISAAELKLQARAVDATSTVAALAYAVDSADDWQTELPSDKIADSPEETYGFSVKGLKPGNHTITLRATDGHGNASYATVNVKTE